MVKRFYVRIVTLDDIEAEERIERGFAAMSREELEYWERRLTR